MLKKIWNSISSLGLKDHQDEILKRQIMLLNRICLVISSLASTKLIMEIAEKDWLGAAFAASFVILLIFPLIFNWLGHFTLSKWWTVVSFVLPLIGLKVIYGYEVGSDFAYMIILVTSFVIFSNIRQLILAIALIVTSYSVGSVIFEINGAIRESHTNFLSTYHFFFLTSTFISLLITRMSLKGERNEKEKSKMLLYELKMNQEEIESKNENLERLNGDLERFVYMASHDLKTPLRNITSFLSLIKKKISGKKDEELNEYLDFVSSNSLRMHHLIEDILNYSVLSKESAHSSYINLNELLSEVKENLTTTILEKNAEVEISPVPTIKADRSKFFLLFQNLIENGLKYNRSEVPLIQLYFLVQKNLGTIVVKDNGIGIPEEYHNKIFEMFTRLHNVEEFTGTGIGLATCKRIVEKSGGRITVESSETGTIFYLSWPLDKFKNLSAIHYRTEPSLLEL